MVTQPEALYLGALLFFLMGMRSPWPWTRVGGCLIFALISVLAGTVLTREELTGVLLGPRLPVATLAILACLVVWWSLHSEHERARREKNQGEAERPKQLPRPRTEARLIGVTAGVVAIAAASLFVPPPTSAESTPWFLAGLEALAFLLGDFYIWWIVPVTALVGLWLAPSLDAHDPETRAPFQGRRDEVPFFLFTWLSVGVIPIVVAAYRPDFGSTPSPPLSTRFWLDLLGVATPRYWWLRELPGLFLYGLIFFVLPRQLPLWRATRGVFGRHWRRLGARRYYLTMTLAGILTLVPIKMALHWLLSIGPWLTWTGGG